MIPDWANRVTLADLVIGAIFLSAIAAGAWKAFAWIRRAMDRIESKTERAVHNTQPNGGSSPHDRIMSRLGGIEQRQTEQRDQIADMERWARDTMAHLEANHAGSVDPATGRPIMPPPRPAED